MDNGTKHQKACAGESRPQVWHGHGSAHEPPADHVGKAFQALYGWGSSKVGYGICQIADVVILSLPGGNPIG